MSKMTDGKNFIDNTVTILDKLDLPYQIEVISHEHTGDRLVEIRRLTVNNKTFIEQLQHWRDPNGSAIVVAIEVKGRDEIKNHKTEIYFT